MFAVGETNCPSYIRKCPMAPIDSKIHRRRRTTSSHPAEFQVSTCQRDVADLVALRPPLDPRAYPAGNPNIAHCHPSGLQILSEIVEDITLVVRSASRGIERCHCAHAGEHVSHPASATRYPATTTFFALSPIQSHPKGIASADAGLRRPAWRLGSSSNTGRPCCE